MCTDLGVAGGHLLRLRHAIGSAGERIGCRVALTEAAPVNRRAGARHAQDVRVAPP
ncbi:hypothetical protein ABZX75_32575 [Streptomyces sp. NPDC003038]|uniref:hypothetical protein n=1 Tax=unclassified Streptomyces TaxID=2593676 RepID=UPI0033B755CB